jgi:hypothetical protein
MEVLRSLLMGFLFFLSPYVFAVVLTLLICRLIVWILR